MGSINFWGIVPYFFMLTLYILGSLVANLWKIKEFFLIVIIPPILFVTLKDIISPDYYRYAIIYKNIYLYKFGTYEPIFTIIAYIFNHLGLNYYAFFFFYNLLIIILVINGILLLTKRIYFSFLLFILTPGFYLNMFVEMRQLMAIAFVLFSVSLIISEKKYGRVLLLLTPFFHYSGVFFTVFFFLFKKKLRNAYPFILYAGIPIVVLLLTIFFRLDLKIYELFLIILSHISYMVPFFQKYINYLTYSVELEGVKQVQFQFLKNLFHILNLTVLSYIITKFPSLKQDKKIVILLNIYFIGVILLNIFYYNAAISRLCYYFFIFNIVLIPEVIFRLKQKELKYFLLIGYSITYLLMFIKGLFYYSEEAQKYIFLHYKMFIFRNGG